MATCFILNIMVHDALICLTSMNLGKMMVNGSFQSHGGTPKSSLKVSKYPYLPMVYDGKFT